jgi:Ca2+-binding RTX toxin-like protein
VNTVDYSATTQGVTVHLDQWVWREPMWKYGARPAMATGYDIGTDTLISIQNVIGGSGGDEIHGSTADNTLAGGLGNDILEGGAGGDTQVGGGGADRMYANSVGNLADDGARDIFKFAALADLGVAPGQVDEIFGFQAGNLSTSDRIDLSRFDANPGTAAPDHFAYTSSGAPGAGQVALSYQGSDTAILVHTATSASVDGNIIVHNAHLTVYDLIL